MYTRLIGVTVGIRELRDNFRSYLQRVKEGEEVTVTERGKVVARLVPAERSRREELIARGLITPATRPWTPVDLDSLVRVDPPLSEEIIRQRGSD